MCSRRLNVHCHMVQQNARVCESGLGRTIASDVVDWDSSLCPIFEVTRRRPCLYRPVQLLIVITSKAVRMSSNRLKRIKDHILSENQVLFSTFPFCHRCSKWFWDYVIFNVKHITYVYYFKSSLFCIDNEMHVPVSLIESFTLSENLLICAIRDVVASCSVQRNWHHICVIPLGFRQEYNFILRRE